MLLGLRTLLVVASIVVFSGLWYGWAQVQSLDSGLTRANVIDPTAETNAGEQNILLVGIDTRVDAQGNPLPADILNQLNAGSASDGADATDTMIVIHIPAGGGQAVGFSIPRDSYVQLAGGYGMHKINAAYTFAETAAMKTLRAQGVSGAQLYVQAAAAGAKNSIQTVENFTGLTINHYAAVNLVGFYDISNAVGGVQVCLLHATQDSYSGANFQAGLQTVQGASALAFVRQRHNLPDGDLDREKRQQVFLDQMAKSVINNGILTNTTKLDALISAVQKSITLDQGWDILGFAQQLEGLSGGHVQFSTIPIVNITYPTKSDGDAVEVNPSQVQSYIQSTISAAANTATSSGSSGSSGSSSSTSTNATVDVYNANGTTGLAGKVLDLLGGKGFTKGSVVTVATRATSVIDYAPGEQSAAAGVASALGGVPTAQDSSLASGHVRVYLGRDYKGPTTASTPTTSTQSSSSSTSSSSSSSGTSIDGVPCIN